VVKYSPCIILKNLSEKYPKASTENDKIFAILVLRSGEFPGACPNAPGNPRVNEVKA